MTRVLKITIWSIVAAVLLMIILTVGFIYKVMYGFPVSYETQAPSLEIDESRRTILLFSKTTGFRHEESIDAGKKIFAEMAGQHNWFLYDTEAGGIFNPTQLAKFDVVVFNNSTGRVLNNAQQKALEKYVEQGGTLIGIHGAGDNSHHWDWYESNLMGAKFSHHSLSPQFQEAEVMLNEGCDSLLVSSLPARWAHADEWYVFLENPRDKGFDVLYSIDGGKINPSGNLLWMTDKGFGMGKIHPVAWCRRVGEGRTFYTSMGHSSSAWTQPAFSKMLQNAVLWR